MRLKLLSAVLIFLNIIFTTTAVAQPSNDNFVNAISVSCGNNYTSSTAQATIDENNAPDSVNPQVDLDAPNIWYSYTGSGNPETITVNLCASGYDTSYLVYTGTSGNLTLVAANDDNEDQCGPGYRSYGTFESDGTTTYYITVTGYNPTDTGDVDLTISCEENMPIPDTVELALPIVPSPEGTGCPASGYSFVLDFATDTTDSGMGGCYSNEIEGLDQFFTWTATTNGLLFSSTVLSEGLGGIIVRNGSAPYDIIDCSGVDQFITPILRGWDIGDDVIIQIYRTEGQTGTLDVSFCLEEKTIIAPPNDTAAGAIPITVGLAGSDCSTTNSNQTVYFNTDTYTTTASGTAAPCRPDDTGIDQFFTWTATSTGLLLGENDDAIGIAIRSTSGQEYACAVRGSGDPIKLSGWQLGEEVIIQIFNFENSHKDAFSFCLREYNTSANDLITGAIPITPDAFGNDCTERTLFFSSDGTTDSGLDGSCNTINTGYDQFFTWTATTNALLWSGLSQNPGIIIRDVAGNEITCANTIAPDDTVLTGWQVGDELIIQIYDWVFSLSGGIYSDNVESSYKDVSFCLKEHVLEIPPGQTLVPDNNFEQALIDLGYDTVLDNFVTTANINTVETLDISNKNISNVIGIQDFTALKSLTAYDNQISSIDLTQNTALIDLNIGVNPLTTIDLTQNVALTNADFVFCQLTAIDVSQNIALKELQLYSNSQLATVDVSTNTNLELLAIGFTQVTTVDVTNNPNLKKLYISGNDITTLDVSANPALENLNISETLIRNLDLSENPAFKNLYAENTSSLLGINIQNGNNTNVFTFSITNTPNLACVQVDDVAYSSANWTAVDAGIFSTDCGFVENDECINAISVPISDATCNNTVAGTLLNATDSNLLRCFGNLPNFTDVWFSFVATETTHNIALQNTTGPSNTVFHAVYDGQTFNCISITDPIYCSDELESQATSLTIGNTYYIQVYSYVANSTETFDLCVSTNSIPGQTYVPDDNFEQALIDYGYDTTLDNYVTTANINIVNDLNIRDLGIFDLTGIEDFAALEILNCGLNFLNELDLSNNTNLNYLIADSAALTSLNVQNGNNTNVTTFVTLGNVDLFCVQVDDAAYSTANWTVIESETSFSTNCGSPVNDDCTGAISIPISDATCNNTISGTLVRATDSNSLKCFGDSPDFTDVWFSFVATETTHNIALQNTTGPSNTVFHAVYDGQTFNCISITDPIYCSDELESQATSLTIGNTYYIQVYSYVANSTETFDLCVSTNSIPGQTYVPDDNFEQALIDLSLDDVLDDYVTTANINMVNDLNIRDLGIFDLTGIEDFAALEILNCGLNFLNELDLSNNTNLNYLIADSAALTSLNVQNGNNTNVTTFVTLGNVDLFCVQVDDAAYSTANWTVIESETSFSTNCGSPVNDDCTGAISIPISDATCNNTISGTLVRATDSNSLKCFGDSPDFTDVWFSFVATETTHNIVLQKTTDTSNTLFHSVIDAQTYNCGNITDAIYCSDELESQATNLIIGNTYYIQVYVYVYPDLTYPTETFDLCVSTNSTSGLTYVPDDNFEQALIDLSLDDVLDDYVTTANISTVNDLNIRDLGIFDLTGIEDFAALEILNCGLNFLGELDLSNNTNLNYLIADNAALTALNVKNGNNTNVTTFNTLGNIDLFCIEVDDAVYSTANWTNVEPTTSFNEFCGSPIQVAAKVYLQGAMLENTDGLMRTDLKDNGYILTASPYTDGIAILATDPVFTATGQDEIVDWIWIELRDANNPAIIIDGKSALLQKDGDIVEALSDNSSTPVNFNQVPGDYHIVIKHRNHLGIMSVNPIALSNTVPTTVDFTDSNNQITYGTNAQTTFGMPANTVAMWCGNANGDNVVQYSGVSPDVPSILETVLNDADNFLSFPTFTITGYNSNDVNMDGNTQYVGLSPDTPIILQNVLAHPGNFLNFSTFQIVEQLPNND